MTNLPVPTPASEVPGNLLTAAIWNANVYNPVTFLTNVPVFFGYQNTVQSVANSTMTAVTLDSATVDTYNGHSTSSNTSRYVAPIPGWYWIFGVVSYAANATGGRGAWIRINGNTPFGGMGLAQAATQGTAITAGGLFYMNGTGDYVELYTAQYSGAALSTSNTNNQSSALTAIWIHA